METVWNGLWITIQIVDTLINKTNHIEIKKSLTGSSIIIHLDFEAKNTLLDNHAELLEELTVENLEWTDILQYDRNAILHTSVYKVLEISNYSYFSKNEKIINKSEGTEWSDILQGIYKTILGDKYINRDADFFEMGGNSLMSTQILSRLYYNYNTEIDIVDFFNNSSINKLSGLITEKKNINNKNEIII